MDTVTRLSDSMIKYSSKLEHIVSSIDAMHDVIVSGNVQCPTTGLKQYMDTVKSECHDMKNVFEELIKYMPIMRVVKYKSKFGMFSNVNEDSVDIVKINFQHSINLPNNTVKVIDCNVRDIYVRQCIFMDGISDIYMCGKLMVYADFDIMKFKYMTQLERIVFEQCEFTNLEFIPITDKLKSISIINMPKMKSIEHITKFPNIEEVTIIGACHIDDLGALRDCEKIKKLRLPNGHVDMQCDELTKFIETRLDEIDIVQV